MIIQGDMLDLANKEPENSFHLIVTSPPYYNARKEYASWETYDGYLFDVEKWITALYRILIPGRRLVWNTSDVSDGSIGMLPIPSDCAIIARKIGFVIREDIIWEDTASSVSPCGSFPNGPSVLGRHSIEHVHVFQKPMGGYKPNKTEFKNLEQFNFMDSNFYRDRVSKQIWNISPVMKMVGGFNTLGHPAPFPEELVEPCIRMWSLPGETVLDPFMGSGTTALSAILWRRKWKGYELKPEYIEIADKRIAERERDILNFQLPLPSATVKNKKLRQLGLMGGF